MGLDSGLCMHGDSSGTAIDIQYGTLIRQKVDENDDSHHQYTNAVHRPSSRRIEESIQTTAV